MKARHLLLLGGLLSLVPAAVEAQTAQRFSFQFSGLYNTLGGDTFEGVNPGSGLELQFRYNPSQFSIGVGVQATIHTFDDPALDDVELALAGVFLEPRYVFSVGSDRFAPYLAARLATAVGTFSVDGETVDGVEITGSTFNAGGGLLLRLSNRTNLDFGITAGTTNWEESDIFPGGSGSNVIARLGLAIGIGR
jgi:hypothetical protein